MAKEINEVEQFKKKNKRIKKALKSYRCRFLKNILIWLTGMICAPVFLFGGMGAILKFVPLNNFTGGNQELLSQEISQNSVVDVFLSLDQYGVEDMPVVRDAFLNLMETAGLDKFIEFDEEKFTALRFSYTDDRTFATELKDCVIVVASLNSLGVTDMMGDLANVSVFKEYKAITLDVDKPNLDAEGNIAKDGETLLSTPELYYYQTTEDGEVVYKRAFDAQGVRQCALEEQLYLPNMADIPVLETTKVMSEVMSTLEINELLSVFGAGDAFSDSFLGGVLEGKRIGDLSSIEQSDFLLKDILGSDNQKLFDVLTDVTGKSEDELTLEDLADFNVDNLHLCKVMPNPNATLKAILVDAFSATYPENTYENIKVSDLSGETFSFNNIKLSTVIGEINQDTNPIIATLIENDARIGTISSDIDNLRLYDIYGSDCFDAYNGETDVVRYNQVKDADGNVTGYTQDDNGEFIIDSTCGVWLLLCFDGSDMYGEEDENKGRFKTYTVSDEKMSHLQEHVGDEHSISDRVTNATIRQLIDVGILSGADDHLYHLTLDAALNFSSINT